MHPLSVLAVAFTKPDKIDSLDLLCLSVSHFLSLYNSDAEAGATPLAS